MQTTYRGKTLLVDNFDSFTWNLYDLLRKFDDHTIVVRLDQLNIDDLRRHLPRRLVLSPGPLEPKKIPSLGQLVSLTQGKLPILGVCLGHQALAYSEGAQIVRAAQPMHGRCSSIEHDGTGLFSGIKEPLSVMRYHSLVVDSKTLTGPFYCNAWLEEAQQKTMMAIQHRDLPVAGLQFHPESFLSTCGEALIGNFMRWQ